MFLIILKTFETTSIFHPKGGFNFGDLFVKNTYCNMWNTYHDKIIGDLYVNIYIYIYPL